MFSFLAHAVIDTIRAITSGSRKRKSCVLLCQRHIDGLIETKTIFVFFAVRTKTRKKVGSSLDKFFIPFFAHA